MAEQAFATYVGRIGEWWDPRYTANPDTLEAVTIEPRVAVREKFGDWAIMLDRYAELAATA